MDKDKYKAITVDTSILRKSGFRFNKGLLKSLSQFKGNLETRFILSEVVYRETQKYLSEKKSKYKKHLKDIYEELTDVFFIPEDVFLDQKRVLERVDASLAFEQFRSNTDMQIIPAELSDVVHLLDLYFNSDPPFDGKNKKNEFPDAIALLSLEAWSKENKFYLLIVSADGDWASYAKTSEWMDCVDSLGEALDLIQKQNTLLWNKISGSAELLFERMIQDKKTCEWEFIRSCLDDYYRDNGYDCFSVFAVVDMPYFEADGLEVRLESFGLSKDGSNGFQYEIIDAKNEEVKLDLFLKGVVSCFIELFHYDCTDKEYTSMGVQELSKNIEWEGSVILTLDGSDLVECQAGDLSIGEVDFGEVSFMDDTTWSD